MRVWTTQIRNIDRASKSVPNVVFYDVTQKSGDKMFAPEWKMVMAYKQGRISWKTFSDYYETLIRRRFEDNPEYFIDFCLEGRYILTCYCKSKTNCHRHLLVKLLKEFCVTRGIHFEYRGEIS